MKIILIILTFIAGPIYSYEPSIIVLMYHRFGESHHPTTNISTELFENQMEYLKKKTLKFFHSPDLFHILKNLKNYQIKVYS